MSVVVVVPPPTWASCRFALCASAIFSRISLLAMSCALMLHSRSGLMAPVSTWLRRSFLGSARLARLDSTAALYLLLRSSCPCCRYSSSSIFSARRPGFDPIRSVPSPCRAWASSFLQLFLTALSVMRNSTCTSECLRAGVAGLLLACDAMLDVDVDRLSAGLSLGTGEGLAFCFLLGGSAVLSLFSFSLSSSLRFSCEDWGLSSLATAFHAAIRPLASLSTPSWSLALRRTLLTVLPTLVTRSMSMVILILPSFSSSRCTRAGSPILSSALRASSSRCMLLTSSMLPLTVLTRRAHRQQQATLHNTMLYSESSGSLCIQL
eukprot:comp23619_c0_seq1/m.40214 comp23619_c0_seq1/g.40214  ORF comp23619_c0_seq1/g.40214 comp23619_c0_seq1/m.40214 type:complete len:321 (+) comp23619_c0_seq1:431-1393(+)